MKKRQPYLRKALFLWLAKKSAGLLLLRGMLLDLFPKSHKSSRAVLFPTFSFIWIVGPCLISFFYHLILGACLRMRMRMQLPPPIPPPSAGVRTLKIPRFETTV